MMRLLLYMILTIGAAGEQCDKNEKSCTEKNAQLYAVSGILNELFDVATKYSTNINDLKLMIDLIDAIKDLQSPSEEYLPRRTSYEEAVTGLNAFVNERFPFNGVKAVVYPGMGVGIEATRDMGVDEKIWNISAAHVLSSQQSESELKCLGNVRFKKAKYPGLWDAVGLTVILLQHAYGDTEFRPYINSLPKEFGHPNYFSFEEMNSLRGSIVYESSVNTVQEMAAMYAKIHRALKSKPSCAEKLEVPLEKFTFKAFQWAYTTVLSRNYDGSFLDDDRNKVLIPFWDLCNHNVNADIDTYNELIKFGDVTPERPMGSYVTYTIAPVKKGQQLFMHYLVPLDPTEAFSTWGFVEYTEITLAFSLANFTTKQRGIASDLEWIINEEFKLKDPSKSDRVVDTQILIDIVNIVSAKRRAEMTPKRLKEAWTVILGQIQDQMTKYKHSSREYEEMLQRKDLSDNQKLIYENFVAEIEFLTKIRDYVKQILE